VIVTKGGLFADVAHYNSGELLYRCN